MRADPIITDEDTDGVDDAALLALQRGFAAALREPLHGDSRARTDLPARAGAPSPAFRATADALITPSATLTALERLELYHRQYWYRLLDGVAEDFPAVRLVVGDAAFWGLLEAYLAAAPPRGFTLRRQGAGLADFIAAHPAQVPHPVHAAELARLEDALDAAFEAGERPPVAPAALATAPLALQPHVTLLACRTPADTLWRRAAAQRPRGRITAPAAAPTRFLAVSREPTALRLQVERLAPGAHAVLATIAATGSLGEALDRAAPLLGARPARTIQGWFAAWTARGWLCERGAAAPVAG